MRETNRRDERSFPANRRGRGYRGSSNNWRGRGVPRGSYARGRNNRDFQSRNSQDKVCILLGDYFRGGTALCD